ncbi:MAG: hypothetical protein ABXS91_08625 [Sulfurimonas sp.]
MTKKDYIVSNTISIREAVVDVVRHDIFRTNGKYCFIYPAIEHSTEIMQTAVVAEAITYADQAN